MRPLLAAALVCLLLGAGCLTGPTATPGLSQSPPASSPSSDGTITEGPPSTTTTDTATESPQGRTDTLSAEAAGERAIGAESERIRRVVADWENLTMLAIGDIRPAEYTIQERNESGVVVTVTVGHSLSFDCNYHVDGATTKARYLVTDGDVRLLEVIEDVYGRYGRPCSGG